MFKRLKIRLYPTKSQTEMLDNHFNAYRYAYNLSLEYKQTLWNHHKINVSGFDMQKELFEIRKEIEWLSKCKAECIRDAALNVEKSYKGFFKEKKGFPKFKSKRGYQSFKAYQSINFIDNKLKFYGNKIKFKTSSEYKDVLCSHKIKECTFKRDLCGGYWATLLVKAGDIKVLSESNNTIGIDLGIKDLIITSEGQTFDNKKFLQSNYYRLRRLQRKFSKTKKGGCNRQKLRIKIAKLSRKIKNQKEHYYHQITNELLSDNQVIVMESLNVKGMVKNRKLSKAISDSSWAILTKMLEYKCEWYGRELIKVNRFFPSSKTCSNCGFIKEKISLSERIYKCEKCLTSIDRDHNAAINILNEGIRDKNTRRDCGEQAVTHSLKQ